MNVYEAHFDLHVYTWSQKMSWDAMRKHMKTIESIRIQLYATQLK